MKTLFPISLTPLLLTFILVYCTERKQLPLPELTCQISSCTNFDELFIDNFTIEYNADRVPISLILDDYKKVTFQYQKGLLKSAQSAGIAPNELGYSSTARFEYDKHNRLVRASDEPNGGYVELELSYDGAGRIEQIKTLARLYKIYYKGNDVSKIERLSQESKEVVAITENTRLDASVSPFYKLPAAVKNYILLQIGLQFQPNFSSLLSEHNVAQSTLYDDAGKLFMTTTNTFTLVDRKVVGIDVTKALAGSSFQHTLGLNLTYLCP